MDVLRVDFDVTSLSEEERDGLAGEVNAQGEASDLHQDAPVLYCGSPDDDPTIVRFSGADVVNIEVGSGRGVEVRQYHVDHQDSSEDEDAYGVYEVEAVSGTAPVTAGSSPGHAEHRGVHAWATIEDHEDGADDPEYADRVVVRFWMNPVPRGLDGNVYTFAALLVPEEHRGA